MNAFGANILNLYNYTLGGFYTGPPICFAYQTSTQSIASNSSTQINFQATLINQGGGSPMWVASSPGVLTCQVAGFYQIAGQLAWTPNVTGPRDLAILANGTVVNSNSIGRNDGQASTGGFATVNSATTGFRFSVGGTIYMFGTQGSGGALSTTTGLGLVSSFLSATWIAP
jgi:hypothetical protein